MNKASDVTLVASHPSITEVPWRIYLVSSPVRRWTSGGGGGGISRVVAQFAGTPARIDEIY